MLTYHPKPTLKQWWTGLKRLIPYIVVPLVLGILWMGAMSSIQSKPVEPNGTAVAEIIGSAGSYTTIYRLDYEGQAYLVAVGRQRGNIAIIRHEGAE